MEKQKQQENIFGNLLNKNNNKGEKINMKRMINQTHLEGLLYESKLEVKESGPNAKNPGTKFISGTIDIATDDAGINIVPVHFTYVTEKTTKGSTNATYTTLMNIIDKKFGSVIANGKDNAVKLRIDSALNLNEFYTDRSGTEELVSAKRNEGGFVHVADALSEDENARNTFTCDMLITNVSVKEADEEKNLPEKAIIKGAIFDFRGALLPVEFSAINPNAINYNYNGSVDRGLCQLNNKTFPNLSKQDFYNPETNIKLAASFLNWCLRNSDYNLVRALAYYNAGWGNVTNENVGDLTLNYIQKITTYKKTFDDELELLQLNCLNN